MANPFYDRFNRASNPQPAQPNQGDIGNAFQSFMNQHRGKNADQILSEMVQSGKISQQQLNAAQNYAQQIGGMLSQFKSMFGF